MYCGPMCHVARRGQLGISSAMHSYLTYHLYIQSFEISPSLNKIPRPFPSKIRYADPLQSLKSQCP